MFGELKNSVEELLGEMRAYREELDELIEEYDEGSNEYEDNSKRWEYINDAIETTERLLDTLDEAERSI